MQRAAFTSKIPTGSLVPKRSLANREPGVHGESNGKRSVIKPILKPNQMQQWNERMIEDETPPPLVPSEVILVDDDEDLFDWEPLDATEMEMAVFQRMKIERDLRKAQAENIKLRQENQRLKATKGVSFLNRCRFESLLLMIGEIAESILCYGFWLLL
ncbi:uncharacterized protein LOC129771642 [Toxorhynchites rutilus septentrionalis]|uniref:uncharacterized protein LOC129771641 n=1 Tax=Toxorhynchites rutilus septentrionalis TaxID=329112 RepID=UPI00247A2B16|nr:uncharacterized protein LOC129771641 [Toxorhynchites rutilus septentrionalis]XP_055631482.1 uncharacterized protein LOC129771641 [Toxorhynchites rutilus septentrionalis]XP_055631483.1 uncharacterized protein LOC129771641 [Toxorhynchites rutilus septentrionalis]XP_055631484.1 uncharacterized protein LOC129771642 [Toxorhynchites rutilus septentrionalis]XP_055631485.1 uncharacterized protein LOC129771642 [Toxorhynchites rutilus septentrionalis]XP_055631486.1 uncharacterized protein LOC12977164